MPCRGDAIMRNPTASTSGTDAVHQPFSLLPLKYRTDGPAQFYALTMDVCQGIQTCIDLTHFSTMDRDGDASDTMPMLNIVDTDRLFRLALTSSQMLAELAAARIDRLNRWKKYPRQQR